MAFHRECPRTEAFYRECPRTEDSDEPRIPVFTVVKNGAVLKNIFVVDKPPPSPDLPDREPASPGAKVEIAGREGRDEVLIVGRHPDCHIMLTHPSISRFHLQIHSDPSRRKLCVVDLSSVHGTWVSEKKIEPGVAVELSEGDTLRVGGSSRVYRLHWVPVSRAYDFENPFVPSLDASGADEEKEEEDLMIDEGKLEEEREDDDSLGIRCEDDDNLKSSFEEDVYEKSFHDENKGMDSAEPLSKAIEALDLDDCKELPVKSHSPSQLLLPDKETHSGIGSKAVDDFFMVAKFLQTENMNTSLPIRILYDVENQKSNEEKWSMEVGIASELVSTNEGSIRSLVAEASDESKCTVSIDSEVGDSLSLPSAPYPRSPSPEILSEMENQHSRQEDHAEQPFNTSASLSAEGKSRDLPGKDWKPSTTMFADDARPKKRCSSAVEIAEESQNHILHVDNQGGDNLSHHFAKSVIDAITSSESDREILSETTSQHLNNENQMPLYGSVTGRLSESDKESSPLRQSGTKSKCSSIWSRRGKPRTVLQLQTNRRKGMTISAVAAARNKRHNQDNNENQLSGVPFFDLGGEEEEIFTPDKENSTPDKKHSIVPQVQTNRRKGMTKSAATASKKKQHNQDNDGNQSSGVPFFDLNGEEEIFTPDKENLTPNTRLVNSLKKISKMEVAEARTLESFKRSSSKHSSVTNVCNEEEVFYSDKENQTPEVLREQKMVRPASGSSSRLRRGLALKQEAERSAFNPLNVRSRGQSTESGGATESGPSVNGVRAMGRKVSGLSANKLYGEPNRSWIMVVDTTSFLEKESRKSLQLLQGLKGTQLVIPRIVIRELDCLKRRTSMFRRTTEVSSALEWIEDSMVNLKWWIHVQRSIEEGMSIAPTPPATPHCIFGDGSQTFSAATPQGSVMDIISPTTEDHILESALFYRKTNPNGQLVLLSNDISLKIKAMAEGILCETAQEFRESLVNPFSNRFMWADSSPRGQTWSCLDDMVLKEKYYSRPSKKSAREGLSGLKLILLHNSQYGQQIRSVG